MSRQELIEAAVSWGVDRGHFEMATSNVADPPRYESRSVTRYMLSEEGLSAANRGELG